MQRAVVVGLTLTCVCLVFALSGPSAQRIAPQPSAPATRPSQVEVANFPAVQQVAGNVAIGNLPAVQTVGGTVNVANLPVDADGNVRVVGLAPSQSYRWIKIADGATASAIAPTTLGPFAVGGWPKLNVFTRVSISAGSSATLDARALFGGEGLFIPYAQAASISYDPCCTPVQGLVSNIALMNPVGPEMTVSIHLDSIDQNATATVEMWLYLSN